MHDLNHCMELAFREAIKAYESKEVPVGAVVLDPNGSATARSLAVESWLRFCANSR